MEAVGMNHPEDEKETLGENLRFLPTGDPPEIEMAHRLIHRRDHDRLRNHYEPIKTNEIPFQGLILKGLLPLLAGELVVVTTPEVGGTTMHGRAEGKNGPVHEEETMKEGTMLAARSSG
jgi:hypothetical protein